MLNLEAKMDQKSILERLGGHLERLGGVLERPGGVLGRLGGVLSLLGSVLDHLGGVLDRFGRPKSAKRYACREISTVTADGRWRPRMKFWVVRRVRAGLSKAFIRLI